MSEPLVSVIFPVFNDLPSDIRISLSSIINQDYQNLEIIVIDDSTDPETIKEINQFAGDKRVKILRENSKKGLAQALNNGIRVSNGVYLARADADDVQNITRIRKQVEFLETNKKIGILGSNVNYIDSNGNFIKKREFPETPDEISRNLHLRNPIRHSVVMLRREVLDRIGNYDAEFRRAEDYELWFRAVKNDVKIYNLQEVLLDYKMANATKRDSLNWQMNLSLKKKYFSKAYLKESIMGILSVYIFMYTPKTIQNFIYNRLA